MKKKYVVLTILLVVLVAVIGFVIYQDLHRAQLLLSETKLTVHHGPIKEPVQKTVEAAGEEIDIIQEVIQEPLVRPPLSFNPHAGLLQFTIDDNNQYEHFIIDVTLDTQTFDYKASTPVDDNFTLTYSGGMVCFTKPTFLNTYCLHEQYAYTAMTRLMSGDTSVTYKEPGNDQAEIEHMLSDNGWTPSNILMAMMSHVELAIQLLYKNKLQNGAELWSKVDENKPELIGVVKNLTEINETKNIKMTGINLSKLMVDIMNSGRNGYVWPDFEHSKVDQNFVDFVKRENIDLSQYVLSQ